MIGQKSRGYVHKLATVARYVLMILLALTFALPIIYMGVSSFKSYWQILGDIRSIRAFLPVGDLSFANYEQAFNHVPVARFLLNSALVTSLTVLSGLFVNSLAGFALARLRWKGQDLVLSVIVATIIIPFEAIAIPLLLMVNNLPWVSADGFVLGWFNTYHVQIVPFIADAFSIYLFVQFFRGLPDELFEAARIDGANWFQVFLRVTVPLSGSVYATTAILHFLAMWNQYLWPSLVIQTDEFRPIMVGFGYFYGGGGVSMAYLTVATIPVLLLFFVFQNTFIRSISATGLKG
jgi:multiple sugar transport system permease protein